MAGGKRLAGLAVLALAAVCVLEGCQRYAFSGGAPEKTVLIHWDGAAADAPGFDEEAQMQYRSGEPGDHVNLWEAPMYFNNRGVRDFSRDKMDARMMKDAAASDWYTAGGPDYAQDDSLFNPATDTDSVTLDSSYDNAWPGTGSGFMGYDSIGADTDGYDGGFGITPGQGVAADAAVEDTGLSGFKAVQGGQMLAEGSYTGGPVACVKCWAGSGCVAGCLTKGALERRKLEREQARKAWEKEEQALLARQEAAAAAERRHAEADAAIRASNNKAAATEVARRRAALCKSEGIACGPGGGAERARRKAALSEAPPKPPSKPGLMLRGIDALSRAVGGWGGHDGAMRRAGVVVDFDPLATERSMPEQGPGGGGFLGTGRMLKRVGVKVA